MNMDIHKPTSLAEGFKSSWPWINGLILLVLVLTVFWPKPEPSYMKVCFQKPQADANFGVVIPKELCTAEDIIVRLEVSR